MVRELLPIDFVIVGTALVAEGGGGTCLFIYSVHAFVLPTTFVQYELHFEHA